MLVYCWFIIFESQKTRSSARDSREACDIIRHYVTPDDGITSGPRSEGSAGIFANWLESWCSCSWSAVPSDPSAVQLLRPRHSTLNSKTLRGKLERQANRIIKQDLRIYDDICACTQVTQ